jgi:hypothetical protein
MYPTFLPKGFLQGARDSQEILDTRYLQRYLAVNKGWELVKKLRLLRGSLGDRVAIPHGRNC